jgi:GntR family transcriptional regulator
LGEVLQEEGDGRPLYQRLAASLRTEIESGAYPPGVALPSERKLMARFGVTRATVRAALAELRSGGVVVTERGSGAFVRRPPPVRRLIRSAASGGEGTGAADRAAADVGGSASAERPQPPQVEQLELGQVAVGDQLAERLQVRAGEAAIRWRRRQLVDEAPAELLTSYVPAGLAARWAGSSPGPDGFRGHLERAGHAAATFEEEVSARMPTPEERRHLRVPPGVPVLIVVRRVRDRSGRVLEVTESVMAADRHVLSYAIPAG